jgi:hypothetical protein
LGERPRFDPSKLEPDKPDRAKFWLAALAMTAVVIMLYSSVVGTWNTVLIRHTQTQNRPVSENTNAILRQQQDCIKPGGVCYRHSQANLARALGSVNISNVRVSAASAACAVGMQSAGVQINYHNMYLCIVRSLDLNRPHHRQ